MGAVTEFRALFNEIVRPTEELPLRIIGTYLEPQLRAVDVILMDAMLRANQTFIEQHRIVEG